MKIYDSPRDHIQAVRVADPVLYFRPHALLKPADWFVETFSPTAFYSVKANSGSHITAQLWSRGITHFDIASIVEARQIKAAFTDSVLGFLHTVKSAEAIEEAYFAHGCRIFALDSVRELTKILKATHNAPDLTLIVRVAIDNSSAILALDDKFGADFDLAIALLKQARSKAAKTGLSFHVGSQAMDPQSFVDALSYLKTIETAAGGDVDIFDIGGGFPALYPQFAEPPAIDTYKTMIESYLNANMGAQAEIWCEPGRALVSHAESLLARVEHITDDAVFINDGVYGVLHDAGEIGWRFPVRSFKADGALMDANDLEAKIVFGPTCDSADKLHHKIALPRTIDVGDFIEFGCVGAYGTAFSSRFNGFGAYETVIVKDDPWPNFY